MNSYDITVFKKAPKNITEVGDVINLCCDKPYSYANALYNKTVKSKKYKAVVMVQIINERHSVVVKEWRST